ncbi:uncharacterized protein PV09_09586 [Verruconis gallopava]|uniref:Uncharacterized protein n=1 Tax=Verruconis gallopava TaxID=253628 RepID=A0A0D1ZVZ3_9PEZI|nr:uncharacterized protein PV09_09586 [Verruconis gallopava]KIV98642.1 hypothetical protein PV09_09586 [Verruconis gallopava]
MGGRRGGNQGCRQQSNAVMRLGKWLARKPKGKERARNTEPGGSHMMMATMRLRQVKGMPASVSSEGARFLFAAAVLGHDAKPTARTGLAACNSSAGSLRPGKALEQIRNELQEGASCLASAGRHWWMRGLSMWLASTLEGVGKSVNHPLLAVVDADCR